MKRTPKRIPSLLLALVLALSLALPAGAVEEGISLDQTKLTLAVGQTVTLTATLSPAYAGEAVTWQSNDTSIAALVPPEDAEDQASPTATFRGVAEGTVTVTATAGGRTATCDITVAQDTPDAVTITPAGPESLPVGKTRQLAAQVHYTLGTQGDQTVSWSSSDPAVATVSGDGLVTAVAEGTATILAVSQAKDALGSAITGECALTVTPARLLPDRLVLSDRNIRVEAGRFVETVLSAPTALLHNGEEDTTDDFTLTYTWTNAAGEAAGTGALLRLEPLAADKETYTCTVTAACKSDSTLTLSDTCRYTVMIHPGTTIGAVASLGQGTRTLDQLMNQAGTLSLIDQLVKGDDEFGLTPAVPGLDSVVFDLNSVTGGEVGTLSAQAGTSYYLEGERPEDALLTQVTFTPRQAGTYGINFQAYGDTLYCGRLEILVQEEDLPPAEGDVVCDAAGFPFTGDDFYHSDAEDPVIAVVFGQPSAGQLVRNLSHGSGTPDDGARYYTNAASDGTYHVSTLSYLPPAGFSGQVTIPMTLLTRQGQEWEDTLTVAVTGKTHSDQFTDVNEATVGTWAADAVDFAYHFGLVNGTDTTLFSPNDPMSRAQLVTILYRAAGSPTMTITTNFDDLDVGAYYYSAVVWANVNGIVNGTAENTFSPNNPITREQLAAILHRYAKATGGDTAVSGNLNAFADKGSVSPYAVEAMAWAVDKGIISGVGENTLAPQGKATRAQVVVMLHRYLAG